MFANRNTYNTSSWVEASKRFCQFYSVDLPYYVEPPLVVEAMIDFKEKSDKIDQGSTVEKWIVIDVALLLLVRTLKKEVKQL